MEGFHEERARHRPAYDERLTRSGQQESDVESISISTSQGVVPLGMKQCRLTPKSREKEEVIKRLISSSDSTLITTVRSQPYAR